MISISGLLSIAFLAAYLLIEWYFQDLLHEVRAQKEANDYVPESNYRIKINPDGTNDYSELYADVVEERKESRRAAVEMSSIEGTETESLLSSLQQELDNEDNQPVYNKEKVMEHLQEQEPIEQVNPMEVEKPVSIKQDSFNVQERIYELRHHLSEFSKDEADMVDIEAMIMIQYELFKLEGREDQVRQIEKDFFMYFPTSPNQTFSQNIPKVHEEDILTMKDLEMEKKQPSPNVHKHSSSKISDDIFGLQRWRGKVVGKSGGYIHFSDFSRRIWIKAEEKINKINLGDELILEVVRSEEEVTIKQIFRAKNKGSQSHLKVVNQ